MAPSPPARPSRVSMRSPPDSLRSPTRGGVPPLMSPLAIVVSIVLIDLLGFSIVMPLLAPFAKEYGLSGVQIGLLFSAYPMCQLDRGPDPRPAQRPVRAQAAAGRQPGGDGGLVPDPRPVDGLHRDAAGADARRLLRGQHPGRAGVRGRRDPAREAVAEHGPDRHGLRPGVRPGPAALRPPAASPRRARVEAAAPVPGRGGLLDDRLGARGAPPPRVAAGRRPGPPGRPRRELARGPRDRLAARGRAARGRSAPWWSSASRRWRGRSACSWAIGWAWGRSARRWPSCSWGWSARWCRGGSSAASSPASASPA